MKKNHRVTKQVETLDGLKTWLTDHEVDFYEDDDDDGQPILCIQCCYVGNDNFWDYHEKRKTIKFDNEIGKQIKGNKYVRIIPCDECCGCAGW